MTDSNVISRRARSRAAKSGRNSSVVLVVALMMALVFVPVLALHAAALSGAVSGDETRPDEVATAVTHKKVPG
ncbi:hypothetical protein ABEV34_22975 [Methylorubrum rhodesianum]|jgi:hypothetical protein|uniref:hypothetical protein n=1 Tax=Methylorubrum TaxID=2282523 RepID=UPI000349E58C|nr:MULTISPECIES: hypothetical protein [Methylorubrum]MBB5760716.1 hypothetical protein [Methylorubrum rhodesianum]MBI1689450.1 hypothetical protein [Methylorubrum sp. DB1722]MRI55468.1 hypothetical protein [Methylobacterium sp. DB1607]